MTTTESNRHETYSREHLGHAAERFARRVARDAGNFAARLEAHASELAGEMSRDWRHLGREYRRYERHARRQLSRSDVHAVFEDIRTIVADVLDGVDELISGMFGTPSETSEIAWVRVVTNRETTCGRCTQVIPTGDEAYVRRASERTEFRCTACGTVDAADSQPEL